MDGATAPKGTPAGSRRGPGETKGISQWPAPATGGASPDESPLVPIPSRDAAQLQMLEQLSAALAQATDIESVKRLGDQAAVAREMFRRMGIARDGQNRFAELELRSARRIGELLQKEVQRGRPTKRYSRSTVSEPRKLGRSRGRRSGCRRQSAGTHPEWWRELRRVTTVGDTLQRFLEVGPELDAKPVTHTRQRVDLGDPPGALSRCGDTAYLARAASRAPRRQFRIPTTERRCAKHTTAVRS